MRIATLLCLVSLFFLFSCTTAEPIILNNTQSNTSSMQEVTEDSGVVQDSLRIITINTGETNAYLLGYGQYKDLIDCGSAAYGQVLSDKLSELPGKFRYLIVTNVSFKNAGGCEDILKKNTPTELKIYDEAQDTATYHGLVRWVPPSKLSHDVGEYIVVYNEHIINLTELPAEDVYTDGVEVSTA
jgi:beta-lactamase superfamily II metal-dependent hydrolase